MKTMRYFQTNDPDEFQAFITTAVPDVRISAPNGSAFSANTKLATLPRSALYSIDARNMRVVVDRPVDRVSITVPLDTSLEVESHGELMSYEPGSAYLLNSGDDFDLRVKRSGKVLIAALFPPLLSDHVDGLRDGGYGSPHCLVNKVSLRSSAGQTLRRYLNFVWREAADGASVLKTPLAAKEIEATLFTLVAFAADEQSNGPSRQVSGYASPAYLRRTEDYIVSHLTEPITLADLAHVARVPVRTLTRAFHQRRGTSPIAFVRQMRLVQIRRELRDADPVDVTVTDIASKYGFFDLGRFSQYYREAFGELPSTTLRT